MDGRYLFGGLWVEVGSGYDAWMRGNPWETDFSIGGRREPLFWAFAARYLNGLPTYDGAIGVG